MKRPTFEQACARYVHRFTCEHVPQWATRPLGHGRFYAPHFRTDREWYDATLFPGEPEHMNGRKHCQTSNQTWPLGRELSKPYKRGEQT